jgi:ribonuclease HII
VDGHTPIAGVDEAGRGPLAGPVVAACVILPPGFDCRGIDDSKKLTPARREAAYARIVSGAVAFAIGIADVEEIDSINILRATHKAMFRAVAGLSVPPGILLVDGLSVPGLPCPNQRAIVGGDAASVSIGAASILAKVTRDRMMVAWDTEYPAYGFIRHKGYGSPEHIEALRLHGPCPLHRRSFAPVADAIARRGGDPRSG